MSKFKNLKLSDHFHIEFCGKHSCARRERDQRDGHR